MAGDAQLTAHGADDPRAPAWERAVADARRATDELDRAARAARTAYARESLAVVGDPVPIEHVADQRVATPDGPLRVRVYRPAAARPLPVLVYFHGGAWMIGSIETHDNLCRRLASGAPAVVVSVDYRLMPENRFPAALDDCCAAVRWAAEHAVRLGGDPARIGVAGDSAGGNLAAALTLRFRDEAGPRLALQLLLYPNVDSRVSSASWKELGGRYRLNKAHQHWYFRQYVAAPAQLRHPYVAPLLAGDLSGLPPTVVQTGELDPLRDEGEDYATRIAAAGGIARATRYPGAIHGFVRFEALDIAHRAMDDGCAAIREFLGRPLAVRGDHDATATRPPH